MIGLLALSVGQLLGTLSGKATDLKPQDFRVPREYPYLCYDTKNPIIEDNATRIYDVTLTPNATGTKISAGFVSQAKRHEIIADQIVTVVKRFGSSETPTWYVKLTGKSGSSSEVVITPRPHGATVFIRTPETSLNSLDCMEQPPIPRTPSQ